MAHEDSLLNRIVLVIGIIICSIWKIGVPDSFYRFNSSRPSNEFDVLLFTQNWPVSVCLSWEAKHKTSTCNPGANVSSWTIHGIWPTKLGTGGPVFCEKSKPFNPDAIYSIQDQLEKQWSVIEKHENRSMLWKREWEKYGTCAAQIPELSTELTYFLEALDWNSEYNVSTMLEASNIIPGKSYNISTIWSAVKKYTGKNPHLACFNDPVSRSSYLLEVRICFDKSLVLIDCDAKYRDCSLNTSVEYPVLVPHPPPTTTTVHPKQHLLIDLLKFLLLFA